MSAWVLIWCLAGRTTDCTLIDSFPTWDKCAEVGRIYVDVGANVWCRSRDVIRPGKTAGRVDVLSP